MRRMKLLLTGWFAFFGLVAPSQAEGWKVVHAGHLLAIPGQAALANRYVVIRNDRIVAVTRSYDGPASIGAGAHDKVEFVDLSGYFVLPGLIDCHVHLTSPGGDGRSPLQDTVDYVQMSDAERAIVGAAAAKSTLRAGFTTVRDLGMRGNETVQAVRDGISAGLIEGPRILAAGYGLTPTGGHMDRSHGFRDDVRPIIQSPGVCDGASDCRRAVRSQILGGANLIKITATGGVLSNVAGGLGRQFFPDELTAMVETAHLMGRKITAHAHGADGINAALRAGVDSIEHGTFLDEDSITLFRAKKAYLVPTLMASEAVGISAEIPGRLPPAVREKAALVRPQSLKSTARAHLAGVRIAFGTDSGVTRHGENAREFELLVQAGLSPSEAIFTATVAAADNIGMAESIGTIESGKFADLIAVRGDPIQDVTILKSVYFVMRDGVTYLAQPGMVPVTLENAP